MQINQQTINCSKSTIEKLEKTEICSKLTLKTLKRRHRLCVKFKRIPHLFLVFLLLNLNMHLFAGKEELTCEYYLSSQIEWCKSCLSTICNPLFPPCHMSKFSVAYNCHCRKWFLKFNIEDNVSILKALCNVLHVEFFAGT